MIPPATDPVWSKLIKGAAEYQFKQASAGMLVFNLRAQYKRDPSRFAALIEDARKFFLKYESVLGSELQQLVK